MLILHQQITRVGVLLLSLFKYDDEKNIFPPPVFDVRQRRLRSGTPCPRPAACHPGRARPERAGTTPFPMCIVTIPCVI